MKNNIRAQILAASFLLCLAGARLVFTPHFWTGLVVELIAIWMVTIFFQLNAKRYRRGGYWNRSKENEEERTN